MTNVESQTQDTVLKIFKLANQLLQGEDAQSDGDGQADSMAGCRIMALPQRLLEKGAEVAWRVNPVNAPSSELPRSYATLGIQEPLALTVTTTKYWGPRPKQLSVSFMESTPADLRAKIVSHLNAWTKTVGISFAETSGTGDVRISRGPGGYWSYLGTDIKLIPRNRPTMNLQGFTMATPDSEYHRVIRHEAGHTLGFPHEHMRKALVDRIDPVKAYAYFLRTQGWDKAMVDRQVLTPLAANSIIGTEPDQDSIMCYQLPGEITYDGQPIRGGKDINATDFWFASLIYPKVLHLPSDNAVDAENDWDPSEDVKEVSYE
ncbi:M12 family metallopeptidase [Arthrobacter sp. NPDC093125]|uniref:M12 family metallopeptidase n=1 Tax=Arthrobacter sp. NPDC093125 TaxID=3363944 RepID=UPI003817664D